MLVELEWSNVMLMVIMMIELTMDIIVVSILNVRICMMMRQMGHDFSFSFGCSSFEVTEIIGIVAVVKCVVNGMFMEIVWMDIVLMVEIMVEFRVHLMMRCILFKVWIVYWRVSWVMISISMVA